MCNIWQGEFPTLIAAQMALQLVAPVDTFPPNTCGFFNAVGNTWDWCADYFDSPWHVQGSLLDPAGP